MPGGHAVHQEEGRRRRRRRNNNKKLPVVVHNIYTALILQFYSLICLPPYVHCKV
jgi:hypothetical protein